MDPEALEAKRVAVKLLATRARTRQYLQERLEKRGLSADAVQTALDALAEAGYVDEINQLFKGDRNPVIR